MKKGFIILAGSLAVVVALVGTLTLYYTNKAKEHNETVIAEQEVAATESFKSDAREGIFNEISEGRYQEEQTYRFRGTAEIITTAELGETFTLQSQDAESEGTYDVMNMAEADSFEDGDTVTIYGRIIPSDDGETPYIYADIIESY